VRISKPTAIVELDKKTQELQIQSKTGPAMDNLNLYVYIYPDNYMSEVLAVCKVEVQSLSCLYSQNQAGVTSTLTLPFKNVNSKAIEVYSSNEENAFIPKKSIQN